MHLSVSPFYYLLEHFNIICANSHETEKSLTEPQNIITWISISFEILDKPPCCVRQCGTSFLFILGVLVLNFCFTSSLHNICSSSGSLFFAHLGGIIFIAHYIPIFITDPINYIYIFFICNTTAQ